MPNHITNILRIEGALPDVGEVENAIEGHVRDGCPYIDFNKILPMPEDLNVVSGGMARFAETLVKTLEDQGIDVKAWKDSSKFNEWVLEHKDEIPVPHTSSMDGQEEPPLTQYIDNYLKYGHFDWYGWANENWGTKWNAYSQSKADSGEISFDTAWSTPFPVMQKLSQMFPKVTLTVMYADEDLGSNCGKYILKNGETIEDWTPDESEALKYACDIKGYDDETYNQIVAERNQDS